MDKAQIEDLYNKLSGSLALFGGVICPDIITSEIPAFHAELCYMLENDERMVLAAPRGFSKSSWVSKIYPLWLALFAKKKDVCIISASETLAVEHLRWIKLKCENDPIILGLFGNVKGDKWSENHLQIVLKASSGETEVINLRAKGAGGQIRGFRPDCLILDDIETDESVLSEEQRRKLKRWLMTACINCLLPGGQLLIIGTVIHPLAVLSDLLDSNNGWRKKRWKAYLGGVEKEGNELWAEQRPHHWLQARKAEIGSSAFSSEYMNDPMLDASAPIKPSMIRYWDELPAQMSGVIVLDPAYSDDAKADFKTAVLIGIDHLNNRYLIDLVHTHDPSDKYMNACLNLYTRNKSWVQAVGVPNSGVEKQFFKSFGDKNFEMGVNAPIVEIKNIIYSATGVGIRNKKRRIVASLQSLFERGKYYIHANHLEARDELLTIGASKHDDIVDAMAAAEQLLSPFSVIDKDIEVDRYGIERKQPEIKGNYGYED